MQNIENSQYVCAEWDYEVNIYLCIIYYSFKP